MNIITLNEREEYLTTCLVDKIEKAGIRRLNYAEVIFDVYDETYMVVLEASFKSFSFYYDVYNTDSQILKKIDKAIKKISAWEKSINK